MGYCPVLGVRGGPTNSIGWLTDALSPLRERFPERDLRRLVLAIRATLDIEALVWLTDFAGLSREEAVDIMRLSARTLVRSAIADVGGTAGPNRAVASEGDSP